MTIYSAAHGGADLQLLKSPLNSRSSDQSYFGRSEPRISRLWIKKSGETPTSVTFGPFDLVDDLKLKILAKYPTSLMRICDPSSLDICLSSTISIGSAADAVSSGPKTSTQTSMPFKRRTPGTNEIAKRPSVGADSAPHLKPDQAISRRTSSGNSPHGKQASIDNVLKPDEVVIEVMKKYFPHGMTMADAFELHVREFESPPTTTQISAGQTAVLPAVNQNKSQIISNQLSHPSKPPFLRQNSRLKQSKSDSDHSSGRSNLSSKSIPESKSADGAQASPSPQITAREPTAEGPTGSSTSAAPQLSTEKLTVGTRRGNSLYGKKPVLGRVQSMTSGADSTTPLSSSKPNVLLLPRQIKPARQTSGGSVKPDETDQDNPASTEGSMNSASLASDGLRALRSDRTDSGESASLSVNRTVVPHIKVLIVEDNVINQKILEAFMRRKKISFGAARNGREAVDQWRQGGYHLILMDIQLPVMTGLEATKEIRRLEFVNRIGAFSSNDLPKQPLRSEDKLDHSLFKSPIIIVALTASSASEDKSGALAAGCNDFLTKPVNLLWLEQKIIEWGCMQALIDFEGWKQWLSRSTFELARAEPAHKSITDTKSKSEARPASSIDTI